MKIYDVSTIVKEQTIISNTEPVYVTKPSLPPLEEFIDMLREIWDSRIITNNGPFHIKFEQALAEFLGVKYISLFSNGTLALITALQALRINGEVITTPYSFVATTHALSWNGIKPVFVDVDPKFCNLNPEKIEAAITPQTTAIMPVHVYGNPCDVQNIQNIADSYGLKVIYDACHAFSVKLNGNSVLNYGDLSVLSFHATKVFTTVEGGAIISHDPKTKARIDFLKNFGYDGEVRVIAPGINAKMNEIQAALGLLQLNYIENSINNRKRIVECYRELLNGIPGISFIMEGEGVEYNYSYFPIFINEKLYGISRDELYEFLGKHSYHGRRYFYPLISQFPSYRGLPSANPGNLPVAEKITKEVICLPLFPDLKLSTVKEICTLIRSKQKSFGK